MDKSLIPHASPGILFCELEQVKRDLDLLDDRFFHAKQFSYAATLERLEERRATLKQYEFNLTEELLARYKRIVDEQQP